jgi:hypothetical protein
MATGPKECSPLLEPSPELQQGEKGNWGLLLQRKARRQGIWAAGSS